MRCGPVPLLLIAVLGACVFLSGLASLRLTEYANGWDGYYYLVQVQSLRDTGVMHSPEYSLVYVPLLAFHAVTGDYVQAFKMSSSLIKLTFVMSVFVLACSLSGPGRREAFWTALLTASLSSMSPSLNFFFAQFPKNLLGFALFFLFAASLIRTARLFRSRRAGSSLGGHHIRLAGVLLLFTAAFFTHRFSAVLSLLFLVVFFSPSAWRLLRRALCTGGAGGRRVLLPAAAGCLFVLVLLLVSGRLPLALSLHDLQRVTGDLSPSPILVPAAFIGTFGLFRLTTAWIAEIVLAAILPPAACVLLLFGKRSGYLRTGRGYRALLLLSLAGMFPMLRFSLTGLAYRLFFGTLLLLPVVCAPFIRLLVKKVLRTDTGVSRSGSRALLAAAFLAMQALSLHTGRSYRPELHDPPYGYYEELADIAVEALSEIDCELLVAHRSLAEVITFRHRRDALPWAPEERFPREGVWRITAGIMRDEVSYYLSPEIARLYFVRLRGDYGLMREDMWEAFLLSIADEPVMMEAVDTWRNPLQRRPAYLAARRR